MYTINENYLNLQGSYLFSTIAKKVAAYKEANPQADIIRLGIGDVTQPIAPAIIDALHKAVDEMGTAEGFHGYGPEQGYEFLRSVIAKEDYQSRGSSYGRIHNSPLIAEPPQGVSPIRCECHYMLTSDSGFSNCQGSRAISALLIRRG